VTDLRGKTSNQTFLLAVLQNVAPLIVSSPILNEKEDEIYHYKVIANDANVADELTYILKQSPEGDDD
jgi:hypothetical protein